MAARARAGSSCARARRRRGREVGSVDRGGSVSASAFSRRRGESLNYMRRACARAVARVTRRVVARVKNSSNNSFRIVSGSCGISRVDPAATSTGARLGRIENLYSTAPTTCWIS